MVCQMICLFFFNWLNMLLRLFAFKPIVMGGQGKCQEKKIIFKYQKNLGKLPYAHQ